MVPGVMAVVVASLLALAPSAAVAAAAKPVAPPRVIIDTDLSRRWDDATALGLAHVLQARGKGRVLGLVSDVPNTLAVAAIDAIDTADGHGNTPVGAVVAS